MIKHKFATRRVVWIIQTTDATDNAQVTTRGLQVMAVIGLSRSGPVNENENG